MYRMTKRIIFVNCAILITFQAFIGGMRNLLSIDLIYNEYLLGEGSVSCGKHWASSCPGCAFHNGRPIIFAKNWCNGDCIWRNSGCHLKPGDNFKSQVLQVFVPALQEFVVKFRDTLTIKNSINLETKLQGRASKLSAKTLWLNLIHNFD